MRIAKRHKVATLVALVLFLLGAWSWWIWSNKSFNPLELEHANVYLWFAPRLFRYCFVPLGTSETSIRAKFGDPDAVVYTADSSFREYVKMRRRTDGWTTPDYTPTGKALIYTDTTGGVSQIDVYYFIDRKGDLAATFIGED